MFSGLGVPVLGDVAFVFVIFCTTESISVFVALPPGHLVSPLVCRGPLMSTVTVHQFFCILHMVNSKIMNLDSVCEIFVCKTSTESISSSIALDVVSWLFVVFHSVC